MLTVRPADTDDVYRDIARVPEVYRRDKRGETVPEGTVCRVTIGPKSAYALLRGMEQSSERAIRMDERLRNLLSVSVGDDVEADLKTVGLYGQFRWAWSASDPAYRVAARLGLLSVLLGLLGVVLGLISLGGRP